MRAEERSAAIPGLEQASPPTPLTPPSLLEPARPDLYNFRFAAGTGFKEKLVRLAEVLGIEMPERNMAEVLERAVDLALERKDPKRKHERRLERERDRGTSQDEPRPGEISVSAPAKSRYIPNEVRERVLERAGYQCEFSGPGGTRCTARTGLQIEHERPFAIFRSHDERFLRAFCPRHNRFSAECAFGAEHIRQKIAERPWT